MNEKVQTIINEAVENMISHTGEDKKIKKLINKLYANDNFTK